ncbi:MAG: hypothetical protein HOE53_02005 [Candidatus Magasanikbacteria bacterium]|jgi:hypothetical protein|nr:hypothetical protein [Candidatus Magasanikbacteria bacterium]
MFEKKDKKKSAAPELPDVPVQAMPDAFYGGKDPVIYHDKKTSAAPAIKKPIKKPELKDLQAPVDPHAATKARPMPVQLQTPKTKLIVGGVVVFLLILGIVGYYLWQAGIIFTPKAAPIAPVVQEEQTRTVVPAPKITEPIDLPPIVVPTTTPIEDEIDVTKRPSLTFPGSFLAPAVDVDTDGLTDLEEEIFNTDSGSQDSDADGYVDGVEVRNLYSPKNGAPSKLIDSGLAREYVNPTWKYRLYYPVGWQLDAVDSYANDVLINAVTGDYVMISAYTMEAGQTFVQWFAAEATAQKLQEYDKKTNRFSVPVYVRNDNRVALVVDETRIYVLMYMQGITDRFVYPTVMEMVWQSFRPADASAQLPEQVPVPTADSAVEEVLPATSTPVIEEESTAPAAEDGVEETTFEDDESESEDDVEEEFDPLLFGESGDQVIVTSSEEALPPAFE